MTHLGECKHLEARFQTRYYDTETEQMLKLCTIENTCENGKDIEFYGTVISGIGQLSQVTLDRRADRFKRMQCTGLKDKNGNLIYEGDIVRTKRGHNGSKYCPLGERTYNVSFDCQMLHDGEIYEKEIIGNIYENPELLKDGE